jgi:hypothetical protein
VNSYGISKLLESIFVEVASRLSLIRHDVPYGKVAHTRILAS